MAVSATFKEFYRGVGYVPLREAWSEAFGCVGAFLLIYGVVLVFDLLLLPVGWIGEAALNKLGIPWKVVGYAATAVYLAWLFKNRETVFAQLADIFGFMKRAPRFYGALFTVALTVGMVSLYWLPFWLAFGIWLAFDFALAFVENMDQLGRKYAPPAADTLVTDCLERLEAPGPARDLFEAALRKLLRIVREYVPPERDPKSQAFAITDAISILALDIKDRGYELREQDFGRPRRRS
jgi:hypothetical protein